MDRCRWLQGFLLAEVIVIYVHKTGEIVCYDKETLCRSDFYIIIIIILYYY